MPPLASWNDLDTGRSTLLSRPLLSKSVQEVSREMRDVSGGSASARGSIDRLQRMVSTQKTRLDEVACDLCRASCDVRLVTRDRKLQVYKRLARLEARMGL
jgi:hypothetical protein